MKVLSHADLVNLIRNTEGTIHVGIGDDEYCCNPDVPVVEAPVDPPADEAPVDPPVDEEDTADEAPIDPPADDSGEGSSGEGDEATSAAPTE